MYMVLIQNFEGNIMENFYLLYERFDYKFSFRCHNIFKCKYNKNRAVICDIDSELQYFDDETNSYKNTKKILLIPFTTDIDRMGILQVRSQCIH